MLSPAGRPLCAMPKLCLTPKPTGEEFVLHFWLPTAPNNASYYPVAVPTGQFTQFLEAWLEDPEQTLRHFTPWVGYEPGSKPPPGATARGLTLADLGL